MRKWLRALILGNVNRDGRNELPASTPPAVATAPVEETTTTGASLEAAEDQTPAEALRSILAEVDRGRSLAASTRKKGDDAAEESGPDSDVALANWHGTLRVNEELLALIRSYEEFPNLLRPDGSPAPSINIPLMEDESLLVRRYCDLLGQQGGLNRRLGKLSTAKEFYDQAARIEANGASFGFAGSYSTVNGLAIRIELGEAVAQPGFSNLPSLSDEIASAVTMLTEQIETGGRKSDPWAWADYALVLLLSGQRDDAADLVPLAYASYTKEAGVRDIKTTFRVLEAVRRGLEAAHDPVASTLAWGQTVLIEKAAAAQKVITES